MYVERTDQYEAGERVQGRLGAIVEADSLNVVTMLDNVFGKAPEPLIPAEAVATATPNE